MTVREKSAASVEHRTWSGTAGFGEVNRYQNLTVPDPDAFELAAWSARAGEVRLTKWSISSLAGMSRLHFGEASVTILAITTGLLHYWSDHERVAFDSGSVLVVGEQESVRFSVDEATEIIEIEVPLSPLLHGLSDRLRQAITPITVTPTETALLALADYTLYTAQRGTTAPAADRALAPLSIAVLNERFPPVAPLSPRDRIIEHIEEHLHDPHLGPNSIAAHFGFSLRWAHHVFTTTDATISRYIRRRRVQVVAENLDRIGGPPPIRDLVLGSGFSSGDRLARAFKAEIGSTIQEYVESGRTRSAGHDSGAAGVPVEPEA